MIACHYVSKNNIRFHVDLFFVQRLESLYQLAVNNLAAHYKL